MHGKLEHACPASLHVGNATRLHGNGCRGEAAGEHAGVSLQVCASLRPPKFFCSIFDGCSQLGGRCNLATSRLRTFMSRAGKALHLLHCLLPLRASSVHPKNALTVADAAAGLVRSRGSFCTWACRTAQLLLFPPRAQCGSTKESTLNYIKGPCIL